MNVFNYFNVLFSPYYCLFGYRTAFNDDDFTEHDYEDPARIAHLEAEAVLQKENEEQFSHLIRENWHRINMFNIGNLGKIVNAVLLKLRAQDS